MLIKFADSSSEIENQIIMKTYHLNESEPPASDLGLNRYDLTPKWISILASLQVQVKMVVRNH